MKPVHNKIPLDEASLISEYLAGKSSTLLAAERGVSFKVICDRLNSLRVPVRSNSESHIGIQAKERNPNWRGGRHISHGYIRVMVNGRYVAEHRIVMEKVLGRPLMSSEVVHHKNGIKSDNRPDNLEVIESQAKHAQHHMAADVARAKGAKGLTSRWGNRSTLAALKALGVEVQA